MKTEQIFTDIYDNQFWAAGKVGAESVSGPGSSYTNTKKLVVELQKLFRDYNIRTILDVACGDFNWMQFVNLEGIQYYGIDIVKELIEKNLIYEKENIHFQHMNLLEHKLPLADLVICRDCFVHFSFADLFKAFHSICHSGSKYLLTTTFPLRKDNKNIETGDWQPLNLQIEPFCLPKPLMMIAEKTVENDGKYKDKSLGLWNIEEL